MRVRPRSIVVSVVVRTLGLVIIFLVCCVAHLAAEQLQSNIICRAETSQGARDELAQRLRVITGWSGLRFDREGTLRPGETVAVGGSATARGLISKALAAGTILILEDASNRPDVVFSRVVPGRWKNEAPLKLPAFVVLIDFADFDHLMGDRPAREAFNVGWAVLHEIDHVVNDSVDSERLGGTGECEDHINEMRRECHLPVRSEYFFTTFPNDESDFKTKFVRLAFDQEDGGANKHRRYWLVWDANQVGGLPNQIATLR